MKGAAIHLLGPSGAPSTEAQSRLPLCRAAPPELLQLPRADPDGGDVLGATVEPVGRLLEGRAGGGVSRVGGGPAGVLAGGQGQQVCDTGLTGAVEGVVLLGRDAGGVTLGALYDLKKHGGLGGDDITGEGGADCYPAGMKEASQ